MLVINIYELDNGVLLRCNGRIVAGEEINILRSAALAHSRCKEIVLDLANVSALDGAGLGLLASLQGRTRATDSRLKIQNPSPRVRQLLELTNLDSVIEITPSREFQEICDTIRSYGTRGEMQVAASR